ncbi:MAG: lipoyl(octanoyl) transferase LipB [Gemmatimonadaceae bacterium]
MTADTRILWVAKGGTVPYGDALALQRHLACARITGEIPHDVLLLLEHPPVITMGRSTKAGHLTTELSVLATRGVAVYEAERGGDVTFHGPGQLVGYPIVALRRHRQDLHWYLRQVEETLIIALRELGLPSERRDGFTGVWTRGAQDDGTPRKIASIGVHARDWVTWHGFALNVTTDLSYFDLIVPCGIAGVQMTSVARELGSADDTVIDRVANGVIRAFGQVFALHPCEAPAGFLTSAAQAAGAMP